MSDFFEYKYITLKKCYKYYFDENYTHGQAADRCFYDFQSTIGEESVKSIAVLSTILCYSALRTTDYKYNMDEYYKLLKICEKKSTLEVLDKNETECLEEDLCFLKCKFES